MSDTPEPVVPAEPVPAADANKPANKRRANRVAAMQFLYSWETSHPKDNVAAVAEFYSAQEQPREYYAFSEQLVFGVLEHRDEVDTVIRDCAQNWSFERIARVDLAILRLAIHELLHRRDIPPIVSINEAIDLSKLYSTIESKRFVNGILDRIKGRLNRPLREAAKD